MNAGIAIFNDGGVQFSTKFPALLVDRTNNYGYRNFQLTFDNEPPYPPPPSTGSAFNYTTVYIPLFKIYHGLGYIPAFETVTTGYGLPPNGGIDMWNEDAMLYNGAYGGASSDQSVNQIKYRASRNYLYVTLFRQSNSGYDGSGNVVIFNPPPMKGVQLNINTQIFAMGLNDTSSQV